jgi:hypothetical protein
MSAPKVIISVELEGPVKVSFRARKAERERLLEHIRATGLTDALVEFVLKSESFARLLDEAEDDVSD